MSRKNRNGRVRCGKCHRVLFSAVRRRPTARDVDALGSLQADRAQLLDALSSAVGFGQQHHDRLAQTVIWDAKDHLVGFYCPKCSIRYEPPNLDARLAEHIQSREDMILVRADITTRA